MIYIFNKYAKIVAVLQILSVIGLAVCSIWYGAWYPDAQSKILEKLKVDNGNIDKPSFWVVSSNGFDLVSPVGYTAIFLIISIVGGVGVVVSASRLEYLEKREAEFKQEQEDHGLTQQHYYESLKDHLIDFFCKKIINFDDSCRASVYRHDKNAQVFRMVFRYSNITRFEAKGRVSLPENEGVIGATYLNGDSVYISDLPNKTSTKGYFKETQRKLDSFGVKISENTLARLNMPSRCYYGHSIRDLSSGEKFAILIVESTNQNHFDDKNTAVLFALNSAKISKYVRHIAHIDSKLNPYGGA
jgi:hypothetical protein